MRLCTECTEEGNKKKKKTNYSPGDKKAITWQDRGGQVPKASKTQAQ